MRPIWRRERREKRLVSRGGSGWGRAARVEEYGVDGEVEVEVDVDGVGGSVGGLLSSLFSCPGLG
jgi:hypothetical protein